MFRALLCPSSGETTVFMRHLVPNGAPNWLYLQDAWETYVEMEEY
jgi:hypothetical protein